MHFTTKTERTQSSTEFLAKLSDPGGSVVKVFEVRAWKYSALGGLEMHFTAKTERTQSSAEFLAKLGN